MSARPQRRPPERRHHGETTDRETAERFLVEAISALHVYGAETDRTERRTRQLSRALGLQARVELGWSGSDFAFESETGGHDLRETSEVPDRLALNRVLAIDRVINELDAGTLALEDAWPRLRSAETLPPANLGLFALACVTGGCGLAVVFGVYQLTALALIAVSCAAAAVVRRALGKCGANAYSQSSAAALLAGLCGAASSGLGVGPALGLVALCPCLILVPGPHLLKGSLDIATLRIPLGASRLVYAAAVMISVTAGLLVGLWLGRAELASDLAIHDVAIWLDAPTAGLLAVAYGVFYAVPLRVLYWPFVVGAAAHALRWMLVDQWGADAWVGAGLACLFVGLVLVPVCERWQLPFSALGFASVVSLVPGALVFRALAGFAQLPSTSGVRSQQLLVETAGQVSSAALILLAMPIGFLVADAVWFHLRPLGPVSAAAGSAAGSRA